MTTTATVAAQLTAMRDRIRATRDHGITRHAATAVLAPLTCAQLNDVNHELGYTGRLTGRRDRQIETLVENAIGFLLNSMAIYPRYADERKPGAWTGAAR
jgi:hypothetical protein